MILLDHGQRHVDRGSYPPRSSRSTDDENLVLFDGYRGKTALQIALNNTAAYIGLACSGVLGGAVLQSIGGQYLSLVAAALIAIAFLLAEAAHHRIHLSCTQHSATTRRETEPV